ncbi:pyruvate/2-oxoglutarate dehydrogenase complex, dehydrogenase component beta subunit [Terriglobus roseus DSM 18391]|uniref:Pyruvate/2-oxoglutarate dehydrogenase complex, dehydrogenase component beta subunit n=1 Tax=Terriglobus roseus (strain DSM 18391 / NRRL B-41598 / KBS 63) TaxID=926566 RepID=I3ZGB2_TERRK|nr:dehydrogenase E1 component subunit alpha/beta [Terriglobus roseus]AFL88280.1 pyruvate/2-oxoglutarate dehydrogenase complex, dehydrogenase component beta subunit [Terriglobus roseus DSM 18391]AFL88621.1 pyruvate/2-oxoglutarate dehydrogenase complex, dehydrogenase component beta subunit [Terriglobus roseus DSM 18391]
MAARTTTAGTTKAESALGSLTGEELIHFYRLMYLSRKTDDREILLKRQQKIFFQISCAGHEALLVAAGLALKPGYDWFFPYYRDRALCLALGQTVTDQLLQAVGADDPGSGGRQMPSHWTSKPIHLMSPSSATGTQCLHAVGCAEAGIYFTDHPDAAAGEYGAGDYRKFKDVSFESDEVVYTSIGEGSTSQGEFWEALNTASNNRLPVIFVVEDNGYAISTPVEANTPGGNISRLVANFPNFHFAEIDGTDPIASYEAMREAVAYCRARKGPALVHGHVIRPYSHALSDDERWYRHPSELEADALRDPLGRTEALLLREGFLTEEALDKLKRAVDDEVRAAADVALGAPLPLVANITKHVYSEDLKPTDAVFATEPKLEDAVDHTIADLINHTLRDEMRRDPRIIVFGEDVADATRDEHLKTGTLKGKGGVFKITAGLQTEFGSDRVFNSPLAEANIVGRAIGMASRGLKPVVEIQFFDYIWPAMHQMRNELSVFRWRSNGNHSSPLVIRVPIGGYLTGGSLYHSQSGESIFTHTPGVRVVMPSNALDAAGLLRTAIRCDDPVLFLEHKRLYREAYGRAPYPGPEYAIPFGKAKTVKTGTDLTVVTYGAVVPRALQAAQKIEREQDISVEVIDLRSLSPYDFEAIAESVRKTNRVIIAHEDMRSWGFGAELAARIADELFHDLDAPVRRVAGMDTFVAYQPVLEDAILPQPEDLYRAMAELAAF